MFEPQHSRSRPKGEEGIWNVFVTKGDCGPYIPSFLVKVFTIQSKNNLSKFLAEGFNVH